MAEEAGSGSEEAARLEAALARISRAGLHRAEAAPRQPTAQLVRRLETLIAEIRAALGKDNAD
jgi:hypothetical protein